MALSPAELDIADAFISHQLDLMRLDEHTRISVLSQIDELGRALEDSLRGGNLTTFSRARIERLLSQASDTIDRYYAQINKQTMTPILQGVARVQVANTSFIIGTDASLPSAGFFKSIMSDVMIQGAPSADWWSQQAKQLAFRFATAVRSGMVAGDTNEQIVRRVIGSATEPGIMSVTRANARALVHTSVQEVANDARLETFRMNPDTVKGMRQLSTLDGHTTDICIAYSEEEWDLDGNPINGSSLPFDGGPPRHWNCRSVLVPVTYSYKELGLDLPEIAGGARAAEGGPVSRQMSMDAWLKRRTPEQLDDQLGKGRAALYRSGRITRQQLLNLRGNPLTLDQLEKKYAAKRRAA